MDINLRKVLIIGVLLAFLGNITGPFPSAQAQEFRLPAPGVMVHLSPPLAPPILKGIKVHPDNPFLFDFILDRGDSELNNDQLKDESTKLIKYFLASLTIPEKDLWVNLSPYEKDRIIPPSFGLTEMGRDLLAEDYMLKQITASLIYPEDAVGKKFWKRIYEEAAKKFGTTNVPVNTFNKVWIVPEKAVVYENAGTGTAYIKESKLKVMLEQDYLSLEKHEGIQQADVKIKDTCQLGNQIVREIVIPELTKEVNQNKNFAPLRQVYDSLILAMWYKKKIKDSILEHVYVDKNKIAGINNDDPQEKEKIYQRYLKAFKKGAYNFIKEEYNPTTQMTIPRKYFSGGITATNLKTEVDIEDVGDRAMLGILERIKSRLNLVTAGIVGSQNRQSQVINDGKEVAIQPRLATEMGPQVTEASSIQNDSESLFEKKARETQNFMSELSDVQHKKALELLEKEGFPVFDENSAVEIGKKTEELATRNISSVYIHPLTGELSYTTFNVNEANIDQYQKSDYYLEKLPVVEAGLFEITSPQSNSDNLWLGNTIPIMGGEVYHKDGSPLNDEELARIGLRKIRGADGNQVKVKFFAIGGRVSSAVGPWVVPYVKQGEGVVILKTLEEVSHLAGKAISRANLRETLIDLARNGKIRLKLASDLQFKGLGSHHFVNSNLRRPQETLNKLNGKDIYVPGVLFDMGGGINQTTNGGIGAADEDLGRSLDFEEANRHRGAIFLADTVMVRKLLDQNTFDELKDSTTYHGCPNVFKLVFVND